MVRRMGAVPVDRPTRVGIVGLGQIYNLNVRAYRDFPEAEIVALCDRDAAKVDARAAEWPGATGYTDLSEFLRHDMDLVEVLVPSPRHCEVVSAVLDAGFHVNLQKPMAANVAEAEAMIASARRANRVLRVMENYLFYEPLRVLKQVIESGEIGEPSGFHLDRRDGGRSWHHHRCADHGDVEIAFVDAPGGIRLEFMEQLSEEPTT